MINCKLTSVQQWSAFNTHQWIICTSRARIFMAVYVSLISKYKFSQAKRFLVKPNAKLCPTSDRVSQAGSQHRRFLDGRKLNAVKQPCLPQLHQEAQVGWGISCEPCPASGCTRGTSPALSLACWLATASGG